ncbi:hypothetical protein CY34DRAFT_812467 [Suillus luteus UH-Slu-Lm8-n1]|uniref:Uncharacterized protein n=1 Tax=Suillus luteus UH-Slu-Lm8-n1 TaxID=930992 RepID=A0A0C9ZC21_9AGAM|nr:hypothetical protein CY34DRAFT_812467 [Suillus luteus UH-Slu-Lm8-n1]
MPRTERVLTCKNEKLVLPWAEDMILQRSTNINSVIDCIHGITYWYMRRNLKPSGPNRTGPRQHYPEAEAEWQ